jgi:hypothetical protein
LTAGFTGKIPTAIPPQGNNQISVLVGNVGDAKAAGNATVTLYASTDQVLDASDVALGSKSAKLALGSGRSVTVPVKFTSPTNVIDGSYYILASVQGDTAIADANAANNVAATPVAVTITQPFVDLSAQITKLPKSPISILATRQSSTTFSVVVANAGNVSAKGQLNFNFFLSTDQTLDPADPLVFTGPKSINIGAGKSKSITISTKLSVDTPSGPLYVIAQLNSDHGVAERDTANDVTASASTITIANPAVHAGPWMLGGLKSDVNVLVTGQAGLIHFSARVSEPSSSTTVEVDEVDGNGNFIGKITDLYDNGSAAVGDQTAGDGLFHGLSSIEIDAVGSRNFVAVLTDSSVTDQQSSALVVTAKNPPSDAQIQQDDADSEAATATAMQVLSSHGSSSAAIKAIQRAVKTNGNFVAGSILVSSHAIQWQTSDGCQYVADVNLLQSGSTEGIGSSISNNVVSAMSSAVTPSEDDGGTVVGIAPFASAMTTGGTELVQSADALLRTAGYDVTEYLNNAGTIDAFKNLGRYDAVVIHSHGGLLSGGGEMILTSQHPTLLSDVANAWDLYFTHRLVKGFLSDGAEYYAITPAFISAYSGSMDKTIVYAGGCDTAADNQMANAFLNQGAAAYIGFTDTVNSPFDNSQGITTFQTLLQVDHNTIGDIPGINIARDPTSPHALFVERGDLGATLPHGSLLKNNDLYINYNWPQTQRDLDSNTHFLGVSVGWHLSYSPYINWSGDDTSAGGTEVSIVNLYSAWQAAAWSASTTVTVGADWYTPAGGSGPAYITIALKNKTTGTLTHSTSFVVSPGQENAGAHTILETVGITLTGNPLNPTVHLTIT